MSVSALALVVLAPAALASDHLFNAATAPGASQRSFANPVALNPSGVSGPAARPGTVPGEGNPNLSLVTVRSGSHGQPAGAP